MTIDRFTPRLFAGIAGLALAGALVALGCVLWTGYRMSIHGYIAIFLGAFLLFCIEPMFVKMLLPMLGGSPAERVD